MQKISIPPTMWWILTALTIGKVATAELELLPQHGGDGKIPYLLPKLAVDKALKKSHSVFDGSQILYSSSFNITSLLVPADGKYIRSNDIPSVFFSVADSKFEGGSCMFVLEDFAAIEVLEGGRDATTDYDGGIVPIVYFGARDGIYKYSPDALSAKRFGIFKDDIIQLQKARGGVDQFFILTAEYRLYKLEKRATVKTRIESIVCAVEFVLDSANNVYYIACYDRMIHIVTSNGYMQNLEASVLEEFKYIKLLRPPFIMEQSVPFIGDGSLYFVYGNGTSEKKEFSMKERPSAYNVETVLYLVTAINGKIYELNVMDVLMKSAFGVKSRPAADATRVIVSLFESTSDKIMQRYNMLLPSILKTLN